MIYDQIENDDIFTRFWADNGRWDICCDRKVDTVKLRQFAAEEKKLLEELEQTIDKVEKEFSKKGRRKMIIEKIKPQNEIKRIYISGPITGMENWQSNFLAAEKELADMPGVFFIVNPVWISERVERAFAHRLLDGDVCRKPDYTDYMREDIRELSKCDCICMLPGWKRSKGARMEYRIARILNMAVLEYNPEQ